MIKHAKEKYYNDIEQKQLTINIGTIYCPYIENIFPRTINITIDIKDDKKIKPKIHKSRRTKTP